MMIKLSDGCYVAADQIAEVKVSEHRTHITVRTKDGIGHVHEPALGESVYYALDRLVSQINAQGCE
jgi:ribosome-associated translation inhibitor RaiA